MEVVVLDELIKVDRQHLKADEDVRTIGELVLDADDVLAVLGVALAQSFQDSNLYLALLVELLPVLKDLQGDHLLLRMVEASDDDAEGAAAKLLLDLVAVVDVVLGLVEVVSLVVVEAVIRLKIWHLINKVGQSATESP